MPNERERPLPSIRTQTASDLWTWSAEISVTNQLLSRAESAWDGPIHHVQSARVLLIKASELLRERAYGEAGRWNTRWRPLRQTMVIVVGSALVVLVGSYLPLPIYVSVAVLLVAVIGGYLVIRHFALNWLFRRFDHPATPSEAADAILAETSPMGQELGRSTGSRQEVRLNILMAGRRAGAMGTKLRLLQEPERVAAARFPSALRKDCAAASAHLYAAMMLLDDLNESLRKLPERSSGDPI